MYCRPSVGDSRFCSHWWVSGKDACVTPLVLSASPPVLPVLWAQTEAHATLQGSVCAHKRTIRHINCAHMRAMGSDRVQMSARWCSTCAGVIVLCDSHMSFRVGVCKHRKSTDRGWAI